jgi:hypothetical protein
MRITGFIIVAGITAAAQCVFAQTLYKLIDKNGKITYSEEKPKEYDGQVIQLNIDPNANTATLPKANFSKPAPGTEGGGAAAKAGGKKAPVNPVKAAQDQLDKAKAALQDAKDHPSDGEMMMVGKVGGGVRTIPSEGYQKKLDLLEQNVKDAEDNLARAEKG